MPALRSLIYGMVALLLAGCGQLVSEKLAVPRTIETEKCAVGKTLVVLPFADYTYADDIEDSYKRNQAFMEALTDELVARGFHMPPQEDTIKFLSEQDIVRVASMGSVNVPTAKVSSLERELGSNWSMAMKQEIARNIAEERARLAAISRQGDNTTNGLDSQSLSLIAGTFNADYIVRGRLIKYEVEQENTWNPLKKGLLPVVYGGANRTLFGVAKSEKYDMLGNLAIGYGVGAALGDQATNPYTLYDKADPAGANSLVWGLGGAAIGYLAHQGGKTNSASVELRIWVQEPDTGNVIWTNRIEVSVKPQSVFAETDTAKLFDTAVDKAVGALVQDFVTKTKAML